MNLQSLGNLGEFIGALAVIASLVYLAVHTQETALRGYLALDQLRQWWSSGREILRPEFVEYVGQHIQPIAAGPPAHWQP